MSKEQPLDFVPLAVSTRRCVLVTRHDYDAPHWHWRCHRQIEAMDEYVDIYWWCQHCQSTVAEADVGCGDAVC